MNDQLIRVISDEANVRAMACLTTATVREACARSIQDSHPDGLATVRAIARRLQAQFPGKTPLTLAGELSALHAAGFGAKLTDGSGRTIIDAPKKGQA